MKVQYGKWGDSYLAPLMLLWTKKDYALKTGVARVHNKMASDV